MRRIHINIRIVDAVMGTGKSVWVMMTIKATPEHRYIVVLPMLDELKRYEAGLKDIEGLVSLHETVAGNSKKERFDKALEHASVILITHALYEQYLDEDSFELIQQGEWRLVMDEVVTAFEQVKASYVDIRGLCDVGALKVVELDNGMEQLLPISDNFQNFKATGNDFMTNAQKTLLRESIVKDVYGITCRNRNKRYYTFSLQERRLAAFESVTILTYPFLDTDLDYWFQIKAIEVNHQELVTTKKSGKLSDFVLQEHSGCYSGKKFKHLIEFLELPKGKSRRYGSMPNHFSASAMDTVFKPKCRDKTNLNIQRAVRNDLRTLFRNGRGKKVPPKDFMFTCKKASIEAFRDSKIGLTKAFIGEGTFVPFNERATNAYSLKHHLAYLYNAFPFPAVMQTVHAHGLTYNQDRYALFMLIQWIWRSAIRDGEAIRLYLPSMRMRRIIEDWLNT